MAGLAEAKDNYPFGKPEELFRQADLLALDEMGYVSFDRFQSEMVFKIISNPSKRNGAMVAALVYRLTSKSFVPDMNGDSFRLDQSLKP